MSGKKWCLCFLKLLHVVISKSMVKISTIGLFFNIVGLAISHLAVFYLYFCATEKSLRPKVRVFICDKTFLPKVALFTRLHCRNKDCCTNKVYRPQVSHCLLVKVDEKCWFRFIHSFDPRNIFNYQITSFLWIIACIQI